MKKRPICIEDGCSNLATPYKRRDGSQGYLKLCSTHSKKKSGLPNVNSTKRRKLGETLMMDRFSCVLCGWDKAPCDRHRIQFGCDGGKYTLKNVVSVCPNCHRLLHMGLLELKQ